MFIKVKQEQKNDIFPDKTHPFFEVEDDLEIWMLKARLVDVLHIPSKVMVVQTLTRTLEADEVLMNILSSDANGVSLMVYSDEFEHLEFQCFLQLYRDKETALMLEAQDEANKAKFVDKHSPTSSVTLVEISDDSSLSINTNSERDSSSDSDTSTTSDDSTASKRKRKGSCPQTETQCKINKRLRLYLEENDETDPHGKSLVNTVAQNNKLEHSEKKTNPGLAQSVQISSTSASSNDDPPYATLWPDKREYIAIISQCNIENKNRNSLSRSQSEELMNIFFKRFLQSTDTAQLRFVETTSPVVLFDGLLWIACEDDKTFQWIKENSFLENYNVQRFRDYNKAHECVVVVPGDSKRNLCDILELVEKQNTGLCTSQWVVKSRRPIAAENEEYVSRLCSNEVLQIYIDTESKELIKERFHFKLSYCFWKITFDLINSN